MFEQNKAKLFQPIPLRTSMGNRYIPFDSSALRDIFNETESGLTNDELWEKYFNIDKKKYKIKGYTFNHRITTNGKTVVISFIKNEDFIKKGNKSKNFTNASKKARKEYAGKTSTEIEKIKNANEEKKKEEAVVKKNLEKENKKKLKEEFKKKPKEEQDKIKAQMKKQKTGIMYIEDAVKDPILLAELIEADKNGKIVEADPGKRAIGSFRGKGEQSTNAKGKTEIKKERDLEHDYEMNRDPTGYVRYSYNTKRRLKETQRLKHNSIIENIKNNITIGDKNKTIKEEESELCNFSCKSVNPEVFEKYVNLKLQIYDDLKEEVTYVDKLDQLNWYSYINTRRHEDRILNELEEIYGADAIFIIGDWSKGNKIKYISTPNCKMLKLLAKRFKVYLIDEYNTSKLCNSNSAIESENLKIDVKYEDKNGIKISYKKEIHAVLTFKTEHMKMNCINRDYNSVKNMEIIVNHLLKYKERPEKFRRGKTDPEKKIVKKLSSTEKCSGKRSVGATKWKEIEESILSSPF